MDSSPFVKAILRLQIDFSCPRSSCIHEPSPVADQVSGVEVGMVLLPACVPLEDNEVVCARLSSEFESLDRVGLKLSSVLILAFLLWFNLKSLLLMLLLLVP